MNKTVQLLVYSIDDRRYALYMDVVTKVVRAVEVTPLPEVPAVIMGAVNVRGQLIPVIDMRVRLGLPAREIEPSDSFIIARTSRRSVVLAVDAVAGVVEYPREKMVAAEEVIPGKDTSSRPRGGILKLDDGMLLIHDLDRFLSLEDAARFDAALKSGGPPGRRISDEADIKS